jgi:hypothetical protein
MLTNIHDVPVEGDFCNEGGIAIKSQIEIDYNHYMGYVDKGDNGKKLFHQPLHIQVDKKLLFHLLDLAVHHSSCWGKRIS